jgi:RNA polymerase sigma-70 factor (ECF subfamily)
MAVRLFRNATPEERLAPVVPAENFGFGDAFGTTADRIEDPDRRWVRACLSGDRNAAELLFNRHHAYVYRLCAGMLRHPQDAEDAAQETFLRALNRLDRFKGKSSFRTWLHRIAVTTCLDLLRRRKNWVSLEEIAEMTAPTSLRSHDRLEALEALSRIAPREREILILKEMEGLTYAEMADRLGCTIEAVRSRLHRARQRLKRALERGEKTAEAERR